jgi:intein/homing endonuclease
VIIDPYLVGVLYGDGWTYKRSDGSYVTSIDQAEKNKRIILEEVVPRFRNMGLWTKPYVYFAKHDGIYKWRSLVYSKPLFEELKRIFANITSYLKRLSIRDAKLFIAGFFDAEGTVGDRKLVFYNSNKALLRAIRVVLGRLNIKPTYIYRFNVVFGLVISRKALIKETVKQIPALKFKMYRGKLALKFAP